MTNLLSTEGSPSPGRLSSEGPSIEIYLFHCGHGDTIIVRLPNDRWGLIDCYLPEQYGIRRKFFRFIEENNVKTFDFIFQTHPDRDHYHGMQAVIEHFIGRGEKIAYYIDTGLNARRARDLIKGGPGDSAEYESLQNNLEEWVKAGQLHWGELTAQFMSFVPRGYLGQIELVPIGPDPGDKRRIMTSGLRQLKTRPKARLEANELSLVIVLAVKINDKTLNVLLGADAGVKSLDHALGYWKQYAQETGRDSGFDAIKIPHHGSIKSHVPGLCQMKRQGEDAGTAAVSAGTRRVLPDREVLRDYLLNGWKVMATTTRVGASVNSLPMMLSDRGKPDEGEVVRHTIRLSWTPESGLLSEPDSANISIDELTQYQAVSTQ